MNDITHCNFFGLKLSIFDDNELMEFIENCISEKKKVICYGYSLGTLPYFKNHPEIAIYSNQFDMMVCDGRGLYVLAKWLGFPVKSDLSIPGMTWKTLELADLKGYSVLIIGSTPKNNKLATERARILYPNARIYNGKDGREFTEKDQKKLVTYINSVKPDILLIGISSPKKESFAYTWKDKIDVSVIIPFGGAIDILSGKSKPIPKVIKKMCLGGYYRFIQEPRRLFRDSIQYTLSVMIRIIPKLILIKLLGKKSNFSIPRTYNKIIHCPIK